MKKVGVLLLILLLLAVVSSGIVAQDATAEPTAELTPEATPIVDRDNQINQQTTITRVRYANLSPDAPTLMVYADGQLTSVQQLPFPSVSGWVEFTGTPALMLAEPGATIEDAVVGPFTVRSNIWTTIAVIGSQDSGTLNAVAFNENVTAIPNGCARVTVFHAVERAPAVTITDDQGNTLVSGLGFPGRGSSGGSAGSSLGDCASQISALNEDAEATTEANTSGSADQTVNTAPAGALQCTTLVMTGDQAATNQGSAQAEATAEATADADTSDNNDQQTAGTFSGSTFGNCGFTFDVPAGSYNFQAGSAGSTDGAMGSTGSTELTADTYYFVAVVGTPDNPQTVVVSFGGGDVSSLFNTDQDTGGLAPTVTPETTPEGTLDETPEATPDS